MPFILGTRSGVKSSLSPSACSALTSWVSSPPHVPEVYIPKSLFSGSSAFSPLLFWASCCFRRLYNLFEAIQTHGGPGTRAAVFFAAFSFFLSQISVNVVACGVVGGMDLAALLPKYLDIRRGSLLVAVIGIAINPWKILNVRTSTFPRNANSTNSTKRLQIHLSRPFQHMRFSWPRSRVSWCRYICSLRCTQD
jgi:hypothetical protein